ncbi:kinase with transmembrane region near N-terminus [Cryptosporidium sp. chipmunk genotype I]|uniref:kinase with transmembrane region near N-terminus n=1 Tax=Cryptosporidium sp. chipmunk genotype I TaxID=1280935 RepID=UPI003519EC4E|nr:kinase with transmembrane region near N-terminus [Cryptosporidium sp. chipmunk genotype I]
MSLKRENRDLEVERKIDYETVGNDGKTVGEDKTVEDGKAVEKYHGKNQDSFESFEFVVPERKKEKCSEEERRGRMRELFKVGNFIELVYSQEEVKKEDTGDSSGEQRLMVFSISSVLGMGAYGIVVLAEIRSPRKKKSRNSITVEITDPDMKHILEKLELGTLRSTPKIGLGAGKKLAIKIVDLEANDSVEQEDPLATARKETSIMSELQDCEQILKYYVTFSSASFLYILMEYAEGGSLYGLYSKYGSFPEELIASVTEDVLKALIRLHGRQDENHSKSQNYILHNDIKSANILITDDCVAKLADFGVSRKIKSEIKKSRQKDSESTKIDIMYHFSSDQEILGSPFWMAPEIILKNSFSGTGAGEPGASDIWSLGITILELAFGRIPWPHFESLEELLGYILKSPPPQKTVREEIKSLFSQEFWDFVDSCLKKDPGLRKNANLLLKHPFISLKAKRPTSLRNFIQTISGVQPSHNNSKYYIQSIFNYVNHFFSPGDKVKVPNKFHSLSNQNLIKKISGSVSISKYFSRKSSIIPQGISSASNKSSKGFIKDMENHQKPINNNNNKPQEFKSSSSLFVPILDKAEEEEQKQKQDKDEPCLLHKRVSAGKMHKLLEPSSIEFNKLQLKECSSSSSSSSSSPDNRASSSKSKPISEKKDLTESNTNFNTEFFGANSRSTKKIINRFKGKKLKQVEEVHIDFEKNSQKKNCEDINSNKKATISTLAGKEKSKLKTRKFKFCSCISKNAI